MNYGIYKNARNASWQCIIDCGIRSLPIKPVKIAKYYGIKCKKIADDEMNNCSGKIKLIGKQVYILYNANDIPERQRFSIMHELGHYVLGHLDDNVLTKENEESADRFAADVLMPACVLWGLNIHKAEEIADLCNVSMQAANIRAERMEILYRRNMFLSHPLERQVFQQFRKFISR